MKSPVSNTAGGMLKEIKSLDGSDSGDDA